MEPQEKWSETQEKYVVTKTFGEDILTVDNVFEIIGSHYDGHFVFIDDSTFYFISKFMDKVRGPFTIDSVGGGRRPVAKYYNEHTPIERFVLFLDSYRNAYGYDKVLFIPDSNLVISNYAEQENAFIKNIIKNKHKPLKQNMRRDIRPILAILAICIGVFVWLAIRKRRSSS